MLSSAVREQAADSLGMATRHRASLLAVATRLAGRAEEIALFQQTCHNYHDAI